MSKYLMSVIPNNGGEVKTIEVGLPVRKYVLDKYLDGLPFLLTTNEGGEVLTSASNCTIEFKPIENPAQGVADNEESLLMGVGWEEIYIGDIHLGDIIKFDHESFAAWEVIGFMPLEESPHIWTVGLRDIYTGIAHELKLSKTTKVVMVK